MSLSGFFLHLFVFPIGQLLDARAFAVSGGVIGKFMQLLAGEAVALAAVHQLFALHAVFDGAFFVPIGFFDLKAAFALHDLAVFAFAAKQAAAGFHHKPDFSFSKGICGV